MHAVLLKPNDMEGRLRRQAVGDLVIVVTASCSDAPNWKRECNGGCEESREWGELLV